MEGACESKHCLKKEGATGLAAASIEVLYYYFLSQPHCFTWYFPYGDTFSSKTQKLILSSQVSWNRHESETCAHLWLTTGASVIELEP